MEKQRVENVAVASDLLSQALKSFFAVCADRSKTDEYDKLSAAERRAYDALCEAIVHYLNVKHELDDKILRFNGQIFALADCSIPYNLFSFMSFSDCELSETLPLILKNIEKLFATAVVELTNKYIKEKPEFAPIYVIDSDIYDNIKGDISDCAETRQTTDAKDRLTDCNCKSLIISGRSSSGKTVTALQAAGTLEKTGARTLWLDITSGNISEYNVMCALLKCYGLKQRVIIIFDNAQAKPIEARTYIKLVNDVLTSFGLDFCITVICWNQSVKLMQTLLAEVVKSKPGQVKCNGYNQMNELIRASGYSYFADRILKDCREDVLVATSILDYLEKNDGAYPTGEQLSSDVYKRYVRDINLSSDGIRCLYIISALGEFEIHVKKKYMETVSERGINELLDNNIVRLYKDENGDGYVYLGHRSMSYMISDYLRKNRSKDCGDRSPETITVNYIKANGPKLLHSMLERLDSEVLNDNNLFIKLWQAFSNMRSYLYREVETDAEWDGNMASMIFAAEALSDISDFDSRAAELWAKQAECIRSRWRPNAARNGIEYIGSDEFCVNGVTYNTTSEIVDFTENIRQTMMDDEAINEYPPAQSAANTDFYRFRDNWLLGLLLGFEGKAKDAEGITNAQTYIKCAERMQLKSGAFYPERVSWVTARVIMGLSQCGLDYQNSDMMKRACDWLLSRFTDKINAVIWHDGKKTELDFPCGGWQSGTGVWNSDIQITLMNLCALFGANCTKFDGRIVNTMNYIRFNATRLAETLPNPLDIVWVVDVVSHINADIVSLNAALNKLTNETLAIWDDAHKNAYEKKKESSDVSFTAKELLNIMWSMVRSNIKNLLSGLEPVLEGNMKDGKDIFISYRRIEGAGRIYADLIYEQLSKRYRNNVFYDMVDLQNICSDFNDALETAIKNAKAVVVIVTDHAFDRCLKDGYDISQDVYMSEIKAAFRYDKNIIAVFNDDPNVPEELKTQDECYRLALKLSKRNAVVFHSRLDTAKEKLFKDIFDKLDPILVN